MHDASPLRDPGTGAVTAFAPATTSNIACGFDILGFPVAGVDGALGDRVTAWPAEAPGVELVEVTGDGGRLPKEAASNTAGVAAMALLRAAGATDRGVRLRLHKGLPLGSGLGSSAASAVAAAVAVDALFGLGAARETLLACALEGEEMACGAAHADNAAPCLYGGFVLVRSNLPPDVVALPVPAGLACCIVRPHVEVSTRDARDVLPDVVPLADAVRQAANLGALVAALHGGDLDLLARSMEDRIAEPRRAHLVPGFAAMQRAALAAGALGCTLSGSGPSTLALTRGLDDAERVADAMVAALRGLADPPGCDRIVSPVVEDGARVISG